MTSAGVSPHGYQVATEEVTAQVAALNGLGQQTKGLVTSASQLSERLPLLGTAPPALHLAMRLQEAAGRSGVAGEITAADSQLSDFHTALDATVASYLSVDDDVASNLRSSGSSAT